MLARCAHHLGRHFKPWKICVGRLSAVGGQQQLEGAFSRRNTSAQVKAICEVLSEEDWGVDQETSLASIRTRLSQKIVEGVIRRLRHKANIALHFLRWSQQLRAAKHACYMVIVSLVKAGMLSKVRELLEEMRRDGIFLNANTSNFLIQEFCRIKDVDSALQIHEEALSSNLTPNLDSWDALICILCKKRVNEAFRIFNIGRQAGISFDIVTYSMLVHALCKSNDGVEHGLGLLAKMSAESMNPNVITYSGAIDGLCKLGKLDNAYNIFQRMPRTGESAPNVFTYTSLIDAYCKSNRMEEGFKIFMSMKSNGCSPSRRVYNALVNGICKQIVADAQKRHFGEFSSTSSSSSYEDVCSMMSEWYSIESNRIKLLYSCLEHMFCNGNGNHDNIIDSNSNSNSNSSNDHGNESGSKDNGSSNSSNCSITPDECTYSTIIHFFCKIERVTEAKKIWNAMARRRNIYLDVITYNVLIYGLVRTQDMIGAQKIYDEMIDKSSLVTHSLMMDGYFKVGEFSKAWEIYQRVTASERDLVFYNIVLNGFCKANLQNEAGKLVSTMRERGVEFSNFTYNTFVHGLCSEGNLEAAKNVIVKMKDKGCEPDVVTYSTLLDYLCKRGMIDDAMKLFFDMETSCGYSGASWNIIIDGLVKSGRVDIAEKMFHEMLGKGYFPNDVTYWLLINGLLRIGRSAYGYERLRDLRNQQQSILSLSYNRIVALFEGVEAG